MNILLALNVNFDSESGGLERSSVNLINYLSKQPSVKCFCAFNQFVDKIDNVIEIETIINSHIDFKKIIHNYQIDVVLLPGGPWYTLMAAKAINGTSCKIITAWHFSPGIRVGNTLQEMIDFYKNENHFTNKLKAILKFLAFPIYQYKIETLDKRMFREAYQLSDRFIVLSPSYIAKFKAFYKFSNVEKIQAISNSLSFNESISQDEILKKEKTILIVARFDESSKRLSYALKIWKLLEDKNPDWKLQLVGDGKDRGLYEGLVEKLKLKRVIFEGKQRPKEFYRRAAIFFMTSRHEGWPLTLTEAQQMGCVPVGMNSFGSLQDIITDTVNGYIVGNNNLSEFAARTQILIDNEELRNMMAWNAVKTSERFSQNSIGEKWLELFESVHRE